MFTSIFMLNHQSSFGPELENKGNNTKKNIASNNGILRRISQRVQNNTRALIAGGAMLLGMDAIEAEAQSKAPIRMAAFESYVSNDTSIIAKVKELEAVLADDINTFKNKKMTAQELIEKIILKISDPLIAQDSQYVRAGLAKALEVAVTTSSTTGMQRIIDHVNSFPIESSPLQRGTLIEEIKTISPNASKKGELSTALALTTSIPKLSGTDAEMWDTRLKSLNAFTPDISSARTQAEKIEIIKTSKIEHLSKVVGDLLVLLDKAELTASDLDFARKYASLGTSIALNVDKSKPEVRDLISLKQLATDILTAKDKLNKNPADKMAICDVAEFNFFAVGNFEKALEMAKEGKSTILLPLIPVSQETPEVFAKMKVVETRIKTEVSPTKKNALNQYLHFLADSIKDKTDLSALQTSELTRIQNIQTPESLYQNAKKTLSTGNAVQEKGVEEKKEVESNKLKNQREVAEYLLRLNKGITLRIKIGTNVIPIKSVTDIPNEAFSIYTIEKFGGGITDADLNGVLEKVSLAEFKMYSSELTSKTILKLKSQPNLMTVDFKYSKIIDSDLLQILPNSKLQWLWLTDTALTGDFLNNPNNPNIKILYLNRTKVDDRIASYLGNYKSIGELGLESTKISSITFSVVANLPSLKNLHITNTMFSDSDAKKFENSTTLQEISISGTVITKLGLESLCKIPTLKTIKLKDGTCPNITSFDIQQMRQRYPNIDIK